MQKSSENKKSPPVERNCNCRNKENCPLEGKCLVDNFIYQAILTTIPSPTPTPNRTLSPTLLGTLTSTQSQTVNYVGLASTTFKVRIGNHKKSFNHKKYSKETTLSQQIWQLREEGILIEPSHTLPSPACVHFAHLKNITLFSNQS